MHRKAGRQLHWGLEIMERHNRIQETNYIFDKILELVKGTCPACQGVTAVLAQSHQVADLLKPLHCAEFRGIALV